MNPPSKPPSTISALLLDRVERDRDRQSLLFKQDGDFVSWTWGEVLRAALDLAALLRRLEVAAGDRVAQLSENRREWIISDLAMHLVGAVHVPLHSTLTAAQVAAQIEHSGAQVALASDAEQAAKIDSMPSPPRHRLLYEAGSTRAGWLDAQAAAQQATDTDRQAVARDATQSSQPDSLATILYTSGTTGEPKGVMLNQTNLVSNSLAVQQLLGEDPEELAVSFLPLSHIFARTCDLYVWITRGSRLALAESRDTVVGDCAAVQPTFLCGVPYFFERLRRGVCQAADPPPPGFVRQLLGGRIRFGCSGGAALPVHLYDFYQQQEVPLLQGYGLTESSPVISVSTEEADRRGAVGRPIPGIEVQIADDGEVLTRGPHVMQGYYRDQAATDAVLRDGWLYTGDLGRLDEDGYLWITGRKKELIVMSSGKNVAPTQLEALLARDPLIMQAMVIGDGRSYLTALIIPDRAALPEADDAQLRETLEQRIAAQLADVSHHEQVRKFVLLPRPFALEEGEMTPKLSLRRERICQNWRDEIEAMYERE